MAILDDIMTYSASGLSLAAITETELAEVDLGVAQRVLGGEPAGMSVSATADGTATGTIRFRAYASAAADGTDELIYDSGALTLVQSGTVGVGGKALGGLDGKRYVRYTYIRSTAVGFVTAVTMGMGPEGAQTAYL